MLESLCAGARLEVLDVAEEDGDERGGPFAPTRPGDVDLADAAHAVHIEKASNGVPRFPTTRQRGQLVQEAIIVDALQKRHYLRMRADHVGDAEECQPHLRRDVVGYGLREGVGRILLAQPRVQLLVEPTR